jgi:peptidyl-prolyl isomerase H (cyclophilin H)
MNPIVFLDVAIENETIGRIQIELRADVCPRTTENFRQFCTGEFRIQGKPVGYKGSAFHRVIRGFMIQGGELPPSIGVSSIYGGHFADENFLLSHSEAGLLSSANSGPNTNGSQFFITTAACTHLDGKHVVFGKVIQGMEVVRRIEQVRTVARDRPVLSVKIVECGEM